MKTLLTLVALTLIFVGCGKKDDATQINDTAAAGRQSMMGGDSASHGMGMDIGTSGMGSGGMHMSGNMGQDMGSMNDMMLKQLSQSDTMYDQCFIDMMIMHHNGAIGMANDALVNANKPELKKLAQNIIASQQKEIDMMKKWRTTWYGANPSSGMSGSNQMMGNMKMMDDMKMMNSVMATKLGKQDADYEDRFIDMMIPHHTGAIAMATDALSKATHPELKKLAKDIVDAQQKEIAQMEEWRKQWYGH